MQFPILITTTCLVIALATGDKTCNQRTTQYGTVCVCNATYCDDIPALMALKTGEYQLFSTAEESLGFASANGTFSNSSSTSDADGTVKISGLDATHQTILGFGGAFTDATGINLMALSNATRRLLLEQYFGETGIQYSIGRIPVGGTDFSTRGYTYCDDEDETLDSFALQEEDYQYKLPFAQTAKEMRGDGNMVFIASAWSAPAWMKTNGELNRIGRVKDEYYNLWATYYIKFFDAYLENNISFWGVTTQNEPVDGIIGTVIQNNGFTQEQMKRWVKEAFGPTIRNSSYNQLKIMLHDDQRALLPILKLGALADPEVVEYADGIALHFYTDFITPASTLNLANSSEKALFRLATEACAGSLQSSGIEKAVELGSWKRADIYLNSIIDDLRYDFIGWIDWNMALNVSGGPTWIANEVDSPIIVNGTADEFYKQPMFYALGHFSKFVVTNSVRLETSTSGSGISSLAFSRPDGKVVVIVRNTSNQEKSVEITILESKQIINIKANSINSLLYAV